MQIYYAKSANAVGHQETVKEHTTAVRTLAKQFGDECGIGDLAVVCSDFHDFGKYSLAFIEVLRKTASSIDHAICGAVLLFRNSGGGKCGYVPVIECINGHHAGLSALPAGLRSAIRTVLSGEPICFNAGKTPALVGNDAYDEAFEAFLCDFPQYRRLPKLPSPVLEEGVNPALQTMFCLPDFWSLVWWMPTGLPLRRMSSLDISPQATASPSMRRRA